MKRLWILSELYYPEESATGHILAQIAEGLTSDYDVHVICAQPTYHQRGVKAPLQEVHNDVIIRRCKTVNINKDVIWQRLINFLIISISIVLVALRLLRRGDSVLVVTNPPLLPFLTALICFLKRTKCVLLVHDVYPEVVVATGIVNGEAKAVKLGQWLTRQLYRRVDHIVVLGRDMKVLVQKKLGNTDDKITIIPNWADVDIVKPMERSSNNLLQELRLIDKFVIQYAGNMGYVHDIETLAEAAFQLRDVADIQFLFIGDGAKKEWLEAQIRSQGLTNITIVPYRPRSDQNNFLNACDIAIMALMPGMLGVSVPSRTYNILSAGKPIIAVMDPQAEVSLLIKEFDLGWVVPPHNPAILASTLRRIAADRASWYDQMHQRTQDVVAGHFTVNQAVDAFRCVFEHVAADNPSSKPSTGPDLLLPSSNE